MLRPVGARGRASRKEPVSIQTSSVQGSELTAGCSGSSGGTSVGGGASVGGSAVGSSGGRVGISVGSGATATASVSWISAVGELPPRLHPARKSIEITIIGVSGIFFIRHYLSKGTKF